MNYNINKSTSILFTSEYNYNEDVLNLLNQSELISFNNRSNMNIASNILKEYNCLYLKNKKYLTKIDVNMINILDSLNSIQARIIFLNVLTYVNNDFKKKIIHDLKQLNKIIINFTSEIEECLLLDYMIVVSDNKIIMEGNTKDILKQEKILKKLGFNLPFVTDLSNSLKYYELIDKDYYDNLSLVEDLWK